MDKYEKIAMSLTIENAFTKAANDLKEKLGLPE
jgi:hypothetical protein